MLTRRDLERARRECDPVAEYIPHEPTAPQRAYLALKCKEALYGGAAGGGKSDALLMDALQDVHVPGYSAIIFRRTIQDLILPGALIDRSIEWLSGTRAKWNDNKKRWTFPTTGEPAKLVFGYMDNPRDKYRYQSSEFQFCGFDELTQFEEEKYLYMFSRLRNKRKIDVPLRMRGATNPGGLGHAWVKRRFITRPAAGRIFVPARVTDNPHVDVDAYIDSLGYLDEVTKARYLEGDWDATDDNVLVYSAFDPVTMTGYPPDDRPEKFKDIVGGIDPGTRDPYAVGVWARDWDGKWWGLDEMYVTGASSADLADSIRVMQEHYHVRRWYVDKRKPSDILDLAKRGVKAVPNMDVHGEDNRHTIRPMINVVHRLIRERRLMLAPSMRWHLLELERYRYLDAERKNAGEVPLDKENHAMDEMRYAICSVEEAGAQPQRKRSGMDQVPRASPLEVKRRPDEPIVVPTAREAFAAQEHKWFRDQLQPRRTRR